MKCNYCGKEYKENEGYTITIKLEYNEDGYILPIYSYFCSIECRNKFIAKNIAKNIDYIKNNLEKIIDISKTNKEANFDLITNLIFATDVNDFILK